MDDGFGRVRHRKWRKVQEDGNIPKKTSFFDNDTMFRGGGRGRGRHPPGLKGRAIGMWYAARNRPPAELKGQEIDNWYAAKQRAKKEKKELNNIQYIYMESDQQRRITNLLVNMRSDLLPQSGSNLDVSDDSTSSDDDDDYGTSCQSKSDHRAYAACHGQPTNVGHSKHSLGRYFHVKAESANASRCSSSPVYFVEDSSSNVMKRSNEEDNEHRLGQSLSNSDSDEPDVKCFAGASERDFWPLNAGPHPHHSTETAATVSGSIDDEDADGYSESNVAEANEEVEHCDDEFDDGLEEELLRAAIKSEDTEDVADCLAELEDYPLDAIRDSESGLQQQFQRLSKDDVIDAALEQHRKKRLSDEKYLSMMHFRKKLPSYQMKEEIVSCIKQNQVIVISGETGCGKTTQVPQFILDDYIERGCGSLCRIVCTQPRRISAISIAERVATERAEPLGETVGYQIRLEGKIPCKQGSILYCTTGIMLKWLVSDPLLSMTSHVILDEIHERDLLSDFLMIIIRDLIASRRDLKVILMSATLNAQAFARYFNGCSLMSIPGFTFPVKQFLLEDVVERLRYIPSEAQATRNQRVYKSFRSSAGQDKAIEMEYKQWLFQLHGYSQSTLDTLSRMSPLGIAEIDYELVTGLIQHIVLNKPDGAILVFVPGWEQISKLKNSLTAHQLFRSALIIPLHSRMPTVNQREVFERPPMGVRKIIIATNIAETSITIDDIVYVVDCGKIKMKNFDAANNITTLLPQWVSKANAKQRSGRAGRVQPGECYHLYTAFHDKQFMDYMLPEMLRTRLEELCLQIKLLKLGRIKPFVSKAMQPPSVESVDLAIKTLIEMNALDGVTEDLTALGFHLARMPVDPHIGKMLLFGALFSCIDPISTIAASLGFKDAFYVPLGREKDADLKRRGLAERSRSDHIMMANAFTGWQRAVGRHTDKQYCWDNFLSASTLRLIDGMKRQFTQLLFEMGFLADSSPNANLSNLNSNNQKLLKAVICAGLYPCVAKLHTANTKNRYAASRLNTKTEDSVYIHPKSVNVNERSFPSAWLAYHLKLKTRQIYIHDGTPVSPFSLLLFGGTSSIRKDHGMDSIIVDDWIVFRSERHVARLIKELRSELDRLLKRRISCPGVVDWNNGTDPDCALMNAIVNLLTTEPELETCDWPENQTGVPRSRHR